MELSEARKIVSNEISNICDKELSEAKERISQLIAYGEMLIEGIDENDCENTKKTIEAWNIIKKTLDNSISKKQHDMIVKSMNGIIDSLQEKLDNSISKDEYEVEDIYPLTIIKDRYCGAYSGGKYTAWNLDFNEIPSQINDEDVVCHSFWLENDIPVGKGKTLVEAIHNLQELLGEE